jgi:hypothetical protein
MNCPTLQSTCKVKYAECCRMCKGNNAAQWSGLVGGEPKLCPALSVTIQVLCDPIIPNGR